MNNSRFYPTTSPYYLTDISTNKFLDVMVNRPIRPQADDVLWTVTQVYEFRPDLLAYDLYNDSKLWWVFSQRNPNTLKDPYFDLVSGINIYVPQLTFLTQTLGI